MREHDPVELAVGHPDRFEDPVLSGLIKRGGVNRETDHGDTDQNSDCDDGLDNGEEGLFVFLGFDSRRGGRRLEPD